jgi:hypothetical protein
MAKVKVCNYRFRILKPIGRSKGKSAVGAAAYISRTKLKDEETGKSYDYRKGHSEALMTKIYAPENAPEWVNDRNALWNNVQIKENRKNSQFARSFQINLPHQLSIAEMKSLLDDYIKENFTDSGMVADVALHAPDEGSDPRNFHAHILLTLRGLDENGFVGNKVREWNETELFNTWRKNLALICSKRLEKAGFYDEAEQWKHGYLKLTEQRIKAIQRGDLKYVDACNHTPSEHKGMQIYHMEKRGVESEVEKRRKAERLEKSKIDADFLKRFKHLLPADTKVGDSIPLERKQSLEKIEKEVMEQLKKRELDSDERTRDR